MGLTFMLSETGTQEFEPLNMRSYQKLPAAMLGIGVFQCWNSIGHTNNSLLVQKAYKAAGKAPVGGKPHAEHCQDRQRLYGNKGFCGNAELHKERA